MIHKIDYEKFIIQLNRIYRVQSLGALVYSTLFSHEIMKNSV